MKRSILIAFDDPDLTQSIQVRLRADGYDVRVTTSSEHLLDFMAWSVETEESPRVDVIVCDLQLPPSGALPCLEAIERAKLEIPVIVVNRSAGHTERAAAYERGCYTVLNSPLSLQDLVSAVRSAIATRKVLEHEAEKASGGFPHEPQTT